MESGPRRERRPSVFLILILMALAAGLTIAGYSYYRNYAKNYRIAVENQLSAIADLKVDELVQWRKERLGDAAVFYGNAAFSSLIRRYFEKPNDTEASGQLRSWLRQFQEHLLYDRVLLLDAQGVERMAIPDTPEPVAAHLLKDAPEIIRSGRVSFLDFHRDAPDRPIHLSILVPIFGGGTDRRGLGILVLRIDPRTYLYPHINRWPTPSRTVETLLVRREGNDVVYLNELKFRKNVALNLRVALDKKDRPAVKAVLGQEGIVKGRDYRGVPVLAALRAVPDAPWFLIARMDGAEADRPLRERLWLTVIIVGSLLLGASTAVGFMWRQQRVRSSKKRLEAEEALRESERKLKTLFEILPVGISILDAERKIVYGNPALEKILDIPREGLFRGNYARRSYLRPDGTPMPAEEFASTRAIKERRAVHDVETGVMKEDDTVIWTNVSAVPVAFPDWKVVIVTSDITARREAQEKLKETLGKLQLSLRGIIQVISQIVEMRDSYTAGHQRRVTALSRAIALEMGLAEDRVEGLCLAGEIHDLGKISVPAEILSKPTLLTDFEFRLVRIHAQAGYDILKEIDFPWPIAEIILQHHERIDGSGYPQGLRGGAILLEARILAAADVVEAIASHRPYRPALGIEAGLEELEQNKGILYDPDVVNACMTLFREKGFAFP